MRTRLSLTASALLFILVTPFVFLHDVRADGDGEGDVEVLEDHQCLQCHGFREGDPKAPFVEGHGFLDSVHKEMDCTDCHDGDYESFPHGDDGETAQCAGCHDDVFEELQDSVHGPLFKDEDSPETSKACAACHGLHDVLPATDRRSKLYPLNVVEACGSCHFENKDVSTWTPESILEERYTDDTHGHSLVQKGLISAATCVSCHGGHDVRRAEDPKSQTNPRNVSGDCGKCHVGILEQFRESVHGRRMQEMVDGGLEGVEPATCTDCHKPHHVSEIDANFKLEIIDTCSKCHADQGRTYRGTYHGRVTEIGFGEGIASCDECHTAHSILPSTDPASSLFGTNRVETCAKCHQGANENFANYEVHADIDDREGFPILYWARTAMRTLIYVTWAIWGLHLLLWLRRGLIDREKIKAHLKPVSGRWYRRWPWTYRAIHLILIASFMLLALTGLPLRFYDAPWASTIFGALGGPENVRFLHRFGAVLTFIYTLLFLLQLGIRMVRGERGLFWGPNSLLPNFKDLKDMKDAVRYFIKGGEPPNFDRWTYYEKFDFLAEAWGVFFIGSTGLVMWFPVFFTQFLPGWTINLVHILHSYEALLATSFIFSMHFFNANLRPGKFPVDPMFLTGRISEEELRHERPAEYERMRQDGRLESEALPPPNERLQKRAKIMGVAMLSFGLFLLLLMASTLFL